MDDFEYNSNYLGTLMDKVTLDYLYCGTFNSVEQAKQGLSEAMSKFEGKRLSASIFHRGSEIARGFPVTGWWNVRGDELIQC